MKIQESGENYLETILLLHQRQGHVRSVDVAGELGYSKASVSRAMGILERAGLLMREKDGALVLTEAGKIRAEGVLRRHRVITRYLTQVLGVSATVADEDACRIEHIISPETFACMAKALPEE